MSEKKERAALKHREENVKSIDVTSSTEEIMSEEGMEFEMLEDWCCATTREWLALHGARLFSLESSKFLAAEARRNNLKSKR